MGLRRVLLTLILVLILTTTLGSAYAIAILPPIGNLNKVSQNPVGIIPMAYGPCKKCRDLVLKINMLQAYRYAHGKDNQWYAPSKVYYQILKLIVGSYKNSVSLTTCGKKSTIECTSYIRDYILTFHDIAGLPIFVRYVTYLGIFPKPGSSETFNYLTVSDYRWRVRLYIINSRFYWASAVVGSRLVRLEGGVNGPPTLTKTVSGVGLSPIITRISWDNWLYYKTPAYATANASINYYYTLELGLLARAYWLNGTPVNLPSLGVVDGYIPTKYWRVLRVYPGSAFSRNEPVIMHDAYMYYVYYVIPDKVFHIVVTPSFAIVLSNASSCLPDTWCPVASKRCGLVVLYCRAKRNALSIALPTDWNTTITYICTLNSTRGLVSLRLESIAVLFQNRTVIGTIYNVGSWNLTHVVSGVTYHGRFPAENFVCANDTYRVDVLEVFL